MGKTANRRKGRTSCLALVIVFLSLALYASGADSDADAGIGFGSGITSGTADRGASGSDSGTRALPDPRYQSIFDWKNGVIIVEATVDLHDPIQAKTRYAVEQRIEEEIAEAFMQEAWDFPVDSVRSLGDILISQGEVLAAVRELSYRGVKESASYSRDTKSILVRYSFPLFGQGGLADLLVQHGNPFPVPRVLGFVATKRYSGIVIYAQGEYELYGKSALGILTPALFPRIYDEEMNLVLDKSMCDPDSLRKWGMAAYSDDLDLRRYSYRIESFPLTIMAKAIYGKNSTDILIPAEAAAKILSKEENRQLLVQGKILIIYEDLSASSAGP